MAGDFDFSSIMNGLKTTGSDAATGAQLGGGYGAAIGAGVGALTSIIQGISASRKKNDAMSSLPDLVDPNQGAFLAELNQKRRSLETGSDFAGAMNNIDSTTAGTDAAITNNTGGDVGGTVQGLLQAQNSANNAKTNVLANAANEQMGYNNMYNNLLGQIAARRMQLQMYQSQQNMAEWAKQKQGANQNFMAGSAGLGNILAGLKPQGGQSGGDLQPENMSSIDPGLLPTGGADASELMLAL